MSNTPGEEQKPRTPGEGNAAKLLAGLNNETDRGVALATAAMLDNIAGNMLRTHLIDLKISSDIGRLVDSMMRSDGPLSSFSSRIKLSFGLGLISEKEFRLADAIRSIRNEFAHKFNVGFSDQKIVVLCGKLMEIEGLDQNFPEQQLRVRFIGTAAGLTIMWTNRLAQIRPAALHPGEWGYM